MSTSCHPLAESSCSLSSAAISFAVSLTCASSALSVVSTYSLQGVQKFCKFVYIRRFDLPTFSEGRGYLKSIRKEFNLMTTALYRAGLSTPALLIRSALFS